MTKSKQQPKLDIDDVFHQVVTIMVEHLGLDAGSITMQSDINKDLDVDSLDTMDLIMALREHFEVRIADKDIEGLKTVADICKIIVIKSK